MIFSPLTFLASILIQAFLSDTLSVSDSVYAVEAVLPVTGSVSVTRPQSQKVY